MTIYVHTYSHVYGPMPRLLNNKKEQSEIADPRQDLFCVANAWKDLLNERSLIANERSTIYMV